MTRQRPTVNAGSMADIAFLLLIFFLVTTTIMQDKGILTRLPPMPENEDEQIVQYNEEFVLSVLINEQDELLVDQQQVQVNGLEHIAADFLSIAEAKQSVKPIVSLSCRRGTSYAQYIAVYDQLKRAYSSLWNTIALREFQKPYVELIAANQKHVRSILPLIISEAEPK